MSQSSETTKLSAFSVFRNRNFSLLWAGQFVSTVGSSLTSLAASILIFRMTGSALSVGLMLMATTLPTVVVGLVAGVIVDRYDRRRIMLAADLIRAVLVLLIPVLVPVHIAWLYVLVALTSAVSQFYDPAHESVLPDVASEQELGAANSLLAISSFGSTAIGFAASGLIASKFSINWAFYLDALSFLLSAACILALRLPTVKAAEKTGVRVVVQNLTSGLRFLFASPLLRSLFVMSIPVMISFGLWNSLLLPFATRALGATEFEYGLQEGLTSVGFVVGSLLMAGLADRLREGQWLSLSFLGMGLVGAFYAGTSSIPVAIGLVMITGFFNAPSSIARRLIIQRNTEREVRGRVTSAFFVSRDLVFLLGMAAAGLADRFDIRILVLISALLLIVSGLLAAVLPGLRRPAAEWRRAVDLLRGMPLAPGLDVGRAATMGDLQRFAQRMPAFSALQPAEQKRFLKDVRTIQAPAGTAVVRHGEVSDAAYFILEGRAVAGRVEGGQERVLEVLNAGDFFGEIAALTGVPRTANVIVQEPAVLLQVPAARLREITARPELNRVFVSKMTERMIRMNMVDLPRLSTLDQQALRDLRTPAAEPALEPA